MRNITILFFLTVLSIGCSPKVKTTIRSQQKALDSNEEVLVFGKNEIMPTNALYVGRVKISDSGFSVDCGWDVAVAKAKDAARTAGGNAIRIVEHKPPSPVGSSCDRITAEIYKIDIQTVKVLAKERNAVVDSTWNYAKLYIYRPPGQGAFIGYNLFLGDSMLCRVRNNFKQVVNVHQLGSQIIWASTETKEEVSIYLEKGKEYYIRCGIGMGAFVGRPKMYLIENAIGKNEFKFIE
ncbi:MAG: hypothetical protein ACKVOK_13520 [Flavobacteriales bacterium]